LDTSSSPLDEFSLCDADPLLLSMVVSSSLQSSIHSPVQDINEKDWNLDAVTTTTTTTHQLIV
jgi:hypothetical protein